MINDKLKALLKMYKKTNGDGAAALGINYQSFANKIHCKSFKTEDLIKIADLTGTQLVFMDQTGRPVITFDKTDLTDHDK